MFIFKNKLLRASIAMVFLVIIILFLYFYQSMVTKDRIIKNFNDNFELFEKVKEYAQSTEGELYIDNNSGELIISNDTVKNNINDGFYKKIKLDNLPINAEVSYIIKRLKYVGIYEEGGPALKGVIVFARTLGGFEQGIVFLQNDDGKFGMEMEKIRDGWYYYSIGHV